MKKYLFIILSCAVLPLATCAQPVSTSADIGAAVYDPHGNNNRANQVMNNALQNAQNSAQAGQAMQDAMNKAAQAIADANASSTPQVNAAAPQQANSYLKASQAYQTAADQTSGAKHDCYQAWADYYKCQADALTSGVSAQCTKPDCQPGSGQDVAPTTYNVNGQSANQSQFNTAVQQIGAQNPVPVPVAPPVKTVLDNMSSLLDDNSVAKTNAATSGPNPAQTPAEDNGKLIGNMSDLLK